MILGNRTEHPITFLYSSIFCIRRFLLVMTYVILVNSDGTIVIQALMTIQSFYFLYIAVSIPFVETIYNFLEISNEAAVLLFVYCMISVQAKSALIG